MNPSPSLIPLRLLVIEDAPDEAELLNLELRHAGYDVTMQRVADLAGLAEALENNDWDVIVSDHSMPGMTSSDALEILSRRNLDLPFIIFSGGIGEEAAAAAVRAGAKDYVLKGNPARLVPVVGRELQEAEARRQRRQAEAAARDLARMREFVLDSANIGEWEIDLTTRDFRPFPRHLRLFGHAAAPLAWNYHSVIEQVVPENRLLVETAFRRAFWAGAELDIEFRVVWPDASLHWLWTRGRRFEPEGKPAMFAGIIADISARKEAEEQLHQALKMEAIGQLTGGIAHDFNNLLTVIVGNSGLLRKALADDPDLLELVDSIYSAGRSGAELTQGLLAFARQQPLEVKRLDLGARLLEADTLLRHPLGPDIDLIYDIAPDLPPVAIDPIQLEAAILNLVINARDAMPDGGVITISARTLTAKSADASDPFILLTVADTGAGMTPGVAARAVEPFFTTKEIGKGSGLGLSMVYGFVRQSAGHVSIDSAPGHGTAVKICLPSALAAKIGEAPVKRASVQPSPRKTTILVVDDDRAVRGFLVQVCRSLGHRVIEAANSAEALAALAVAPDIELLFSNVAMPDGMNGYELAKEVRHLRPGLKILLTSGFPAKDVFQRGALDADIRMLQKPYDPDELAAAIGETLAAAPTLATADAGVPKRRDSMRRKPR